mmetsp:Transcript_14440/g.33100  ORF Transcript_14440/g.33100 Transcript_14440/m.33100 type:complete len:270 (+) Transcript_14440:445-1254(+)
MSWERAVCEWAGGARNRGARDEDEVPKTARSRQRSGCHRNCNHRRRSGQRRRAALDCDDDDERNGCGACRTQAAAPAWNEGEPATFVHLWRHRGNDGKDNRSSARPSQDHLPDVAAAIQLPRRRAEDAKPCTTGGCACAVEGKRRCDASRRAVCCAALCSPRVVCRCPEETWNGRSSSRDGEKVSCRCWCGRICNVRSLPSGRRTRKNGGRRARHLPQPMGYGMHADRIRAWHPRPLLGSRPHASGHSRVQRNHVDDLRNVEGAPTPIA